MSSSSISFSEQEMIRTHGLPVLLDRREEDDVVDADHVRLHLREHARQILLRPLRGVDDRRPAVLHVVVDLVVGRFPEVRDVAVDEVLPEFRHLLGRHRRGEVHRMRLEAIALVDRDEARVGEEHRLVAERLDGLRDADRVQRRAEGGFGKEGDRLSRHGRRSPSTQSTKMRVSAGDQPISTVSPAATLRRSASSAVSRTRRGFWERPVSTLSCRSRP